jgi:hypothetical protein
MITVGIGITDLIALVIFGAFRRGAKQRLHGSFFRR